MTCTFPRTPRPDPSSRHVFARLQREWERAARQRDSVARVNGWHIVETDVESLDELLDALEQRSERADELLRRLVGLAATDALAARIALQRVLPNLAAVASRYASGIERRLELSEDLAAAAWTVIRTFSPDRHPRVMAQAIACDARDRVLRVGARRSWTVVHLPSHLLDLPVEADVAPVEPMLELAQVLSDAMAAGLSADDATFLRLSVTASPEEMAATLGITERMVRYRRRAVVARVRAAIGDATDGCEDTVEVAA